MDGANAGLRLPPDKASADRLASPEPARVTVTVYVLVVVPFWAVTMVVTVLAPTASAIAPEALPLVVATPLTVTEAVASSTVGVTVSEVVALLTLAV
ncbi:hypothetical protein D3C87_1201530 [compost metagenome]